MTMALIYSKILLDSWWKIKKKEIILYVTKGLLLIYSPTKSILSKNI